MKEVYTTVYTDKGHSIAFWSIMRFQEQEKSDKTKQRFGSKLEEMAEPDGLSRQLFKLSQDFCSLASPYPVVVVRYHFFI